jgi:uncharacterized protein (DUF1501 family)
MDLDLSRRRFLQGSAAIGAGTALGACSSSGDPEAEPDVTATAPAGPAAATASGDGTLVIVTLYGGNDALNTVVPIADEGYARQRGALALAPDAVHPLSDGFALHPALGRTATLWDDGRLAVVHGVGFSGLDRSHFHCMDVWQAAGEDTTGWLGRWLDLADDDPLAAVVVGRQLPLLARGRQHAAAVVPAGPFTLPGDAALRGNLTTLTAVADRPALQALVARSGADLLHVADRVGPLVAGSTDDDSLAAGLATVATLIEADLPTRTYAVDLGGFDTHAGQLPTHDALLGELDAALGDFLERVGGRPVTVLVYSEFGRRVVPNASAGTDHGAGGTVLLAGHVRGGHHGEPPALDRLVDGDLATTTDFRAVYGGLLEGVLGTASGDVLTDAPTPLVLV